MAKVIESFDFRSRRVHSDYDWDNWLDGQVWQLEEGQDYACKPGSMRLLAMGAAKRRKLRVHVSVDSKTGVVTLQAYPVDAGDEGPEGNGKQAESNGEDGEYVDLSDDTTEDSEEDESGQDEDWKKLTVKKLRALLDENTVPYDPTASKAALIQAAVKAGL